MKGVKKKHLPQKVCAACGRPFTWRKKWERFGKKSNTVRTNAGVSVNTALKLDKESQTSSAGPLT